MHYLALTFKHAVEFSSFGCTPRICLGDSCLGQLDLLYSSPSPESNPVSDPFFAALKNPNCFHNLVSRQLDLLYSDPRSESNPTFRSQLHFFAVFTLVVPASRQPDLPYQDLGSSQVTRSPSRPRPRLAGPRSCRRVAERAGPRVTWLWWVSSQVGRCLEFPPCRVPHPSRLRERYACGARESTRPAVTALTPSRDVLARATSGRGIPHRLSACPVG